MTATNGKKFLDVLSGQAVSPPPVWMMRQAGRHLPEYLETRSRARDFLDFCYTPSLAAEATLQPVRRYGMDAAILFADILLILDAMGLGVRFEKGEGPLVETISGPSDLGRVKPQAAPDKLSPVYETVARVKAALPKETALIGFAGSPWTVTLYAAEGRGKTDKSAGWRWAHGRPEDLAAAMDLVSEATAQYLVRQVDAGADALMLFDSWAEGLPDNIFEEVIIRPTRQLVARLRERLDLRRLPARTGISLARDAAGTIRRIGVRDDEFRMIERSLAVLNTRIGQVLHELDNLFNTLQQRAFKGQL